MHKILQQMLMNVFFEPCKNNGSCVNTPGSFHCQCVDDWDGPLCETDLCKTEAARLVFVVDSSYSSQGETFRKQLQYIIDAILRITISDEKFKVAVISYGTKSNVAIDFDSYQNKTELLEQINNVSFINGTTNMASACSAVKRILPLTPHGYQFVFLFTDGMPTTLSTAVNSISDLRTYLKRSQEWNEVFLVAFGDDVRHEGFTMLSGDRRYSDVYPSTDLEPLYQVFKRRVNVKCKACKVRRDMDLVFALDTSSAQSPSTYLACRGIFQQLLQSMDEFVFLGPNLIQIGAVHFSDEASYFLPMNFTHDIDTFASTFQDSKQDDYNSTSRLSNALRFIQREMLSNKRGTRNSALKYVILVYNGFDKNATDSFSVAEDMINKGITLISIGVGTNYKHEDVLKMSSSPFHAYLTEQDTSTNQWTLLNSELEFIKKVTNSRLQCTNRVNA